MFDGSLHHNTALKSLRITFHLAKVVHGRKILYEGPKYRRSHDEQYQKQRYDSYDLRQTDPQAGNSSKTEHFSPQKQLSASEKSKQVLAIEAPPGRSQQQWKISRQGSRWPNCQKNREYQAYV